MGTYKQKGIHFYWSIFIPHSTIILVVVESRNNSSYPYYSPHPLYLGKSEVKIVRRDLVPQTLNLEREIPTEHGGLSRWFISC